MPPIIELERITKRYGSLLALDDVSLQIEPGITGLLGPNGAGKSTLIKILLGLLRSTQGQGQLLGYALGRQSRKIRTCVGYMPEDDCYLHGLTGIESVQLMAQLSRLPALEALRRSHEILDFCSIQQERYRLVETYSTGMRQNLRFAQAIVHDPQVLILDEPTSGLDPHQRDAMLNRLTLLARDQGKTILLCTHILPDVQVVSDAVVILAKGKVRLAERLEGLNRPATPAIEVQVQGKTDLFIRLIEEAGFHVTAMGQSLLVSGNSQQSISQQLWPLACQAKVGIRALLPSRTSLEKIFLGAVKETQDGPQ